MKRFLSCLMALLLLALSLGGCAAPGGNPSGNSFDMEKAGVGFDFPQELQEIKAAIQPSYGAELAQGSGLYVSGLQYCAMNRNKYRDLAKKKSLSDDDLAFISPRMIDFLLVYTIDKNRTMDDLLSLAPLYGLPVAGIKELGSLGEYSYFYVVDPYEENLEGSFIFDEGFREEYDGIVKFCMEDDMDWIRMFEPKGIETAGDGSLVSFETEDLEGNKIKSEDIFSAHRLTMVNIWGTYCGPCIREMPDLEVLNQRLGEKDCAIIGIVCDVASSTDSKMVKAAEDIISDTGVTYLNILPWKNFYKDLPTAYIPTTYFVDSEGRIIGEPAIGARGADDYEKLLDDILKTLE